jgi:transposase
MPQALAHEKAQVIRGMLELDLPHADIATRANVSLRQVRRIKHNIIRYGTIQRPKLPAQGRKRVMTEEMEEVRVFSPDY